MRTLIYITIGNIIALPLALLFVVYFTTANPVGTMGELMITALVLVTVFCIVTGLIYHFTHPQEKEGGK